MTFSSDPVSKAAAGDRDGGTVVIRLHSLGDVVLSQPAASRLSGNGPVNFVTSSEYLPVVRRMDGLNAVGHIRDSGVSGLRRLLRELSPDRIVDLQNSLTTRLATIGMPVSGRFRFSRDLRKRILRGEEGEMPSRRLDFLRAAGFGSGDMPELTRERPVPDGLAVGLVAGGRWRLKTIPEGVLAEAARLCIDLYGASVILMGGPEDRRLIESTAASVMRGPVSTYCGGDGLRGLLRVIEGLRLLVSPDSGPAHLAAALDVPVMVVFTSTSPSLGFWNDNGAGTYMVDGIGCRPCHRHGGTECGRGDEACRRSIVPLDLVRRSMELVKR